MFFGGFVHGFCVTNLLFLCLLSVHAEQPRARRVSEVPFDVVQLSEVDEDEARQAVRNYTTLLSDAELATINRAAHLANRGVSYMRLGEYDRALDDLDESIVLHPYITGTYMAKAQIMVIRTDYIDALGALRKAGELSQNASIFGAKALCNLQLGRKKTAMQNVREGLQLYPQDARLLKLRSLIYEESGQEYKAAVANRAAVLVDTNVVQVFDQVLNQPMVQVPQPPVQVDYAELQQRAVQLFSALEFADAVVLLDQVLEAHPENNVARLYRARALVASGRHSRAVADLDVLLGVLPDGFALLKLRAEAAYGASQYERAEQDCRKALGLRPDDEQLLELLQRILQETGAGVSSR